MNSRRPRGSRRSPGEAEVLQPVQSGSGPCPWSRIPRSLLLYLQQDISFYTAQLIFAEEPCESRNTWSNSQIWPWNEAGQRLIEFCQENALVITNTLFQQHKRRLYAWTSPDGQHQNQIDYIL